MWGNIFGINSNAYQPVVKHDHSAGCRMLGRPGELVIDLDPINQELLLECTHPSHDSVRQIFMILCDGDRSKEIEEGRLF